LSGVQVVLVGRQNIEPVLTNTFFAGLKVKVSYIKVSTTHQIGNQAIQPRVAQIIVLIVPKLHPTRTHFSYLPVNTSFIGVSKISADFLYSRHFFGKPDFLVTESSEH
jgi:hypothetical protein